MERYACMELFSNTTICATLQRIFVDSEKNAINARWVANLYHARSPSTRATSVSLQ